MTEQGTTPNLDAWLGVRGLIEVRRAQDEPDEAYLDQLAGLAVGSEPAAKLLRTIRYKFEQGEHAGVVRLDDPDAARNAAATEVAQRLINVGYLTGARSTGGRLHFSLNQVSEAQRERLLSFLRGAWLERGAREVARIALGAEAELASNLELRDADGRRYEIDLAIAQPGGHTILVECKARNGVARCLPRLRDLCDVFGVDGPNAIMVSGAVEPGVVADALAFHRITIVAPDQLGAHLARLASDATQARALVADGEFIADVRDRLTVIALPGPARVSDAVADTCA